MKELLHFNSLERIPYSEQPLPQQSAIRYLTPEQFQHKFGVVYSESIFCGRFMFIKFRKFRNYLTKMDVGKLRKAITKLEQQAPQNLVICRMDSKVGYGVFTSEPIKKDSLVCLYSGKLIARKRTTHDHNYAFAYPYSKLSYNPEATRGIAPFMQHLPELQRCSTETLTQIAEAWEPRNVYLPTGENTKVRGTVIVQEEEMFTTQFKPEVLPELATANLVAQLIVYNRVPVIAFTAIRDIEAREQVGCSYHHYYWDSCHKVPEYFAKGGSVLDTSCYRRIFGRLVFPEFYWTGNYLRLLPQLESKEPIIMLGDDGKIYTISAMQLRVELERVNAL